MVIDITQLLENKIMSVCLEEFIKFPRNYNFSNNNDVKVIITVDFIKLEEIIIAKLQIKSNLALNCDRCLDKINYNLNINTEEKFSSNKNLINETEDIWFFEKNKINLESCICTSIFTNIPMSIICKKECKGLCSICGINLNLYSCDCNNKFNNSSFETLRYLFINDKEV